jgi:Acetyl-CoA acetyltransferase
VPMGGNKPSYNPRLFEDDNLGIAFGMGLTAERVAAQWKVPREAQDRFALTSHERAVMAQQRGEFRDEITPLDVIDRVPELATGEVTQRHRRLEADEGPRVDTSLEALARLKPAFAAQGSVTAGNSSQMSDGAAALILVSDSALRRFNLAPLARFLPLRCAACRRRSWVSVPWRRFPPRCGPPGCDRTSSDGSNSMRRSPRSRSR